MKSNVEPLEGNKVKLSVEVDEHEFEPAVDAAYKKIARDIRIPGFRPGKAPRKLIQARIGAGYARSEAMREIIPSFYDRAAREHQVDAIDQPDIDVTGGEESGPVTFDATVAVRPRVEIEGYGGLKVTIPHPAATEKDVEEQIDRLRDQFADIKDVDREIKEGDVVQIDLVTRRGEEELDNVSAYSHELGTPGGLPPEVDEHLLGAKVGDEREFSVTVPQPVHAKDEDNANGEDHEDSPKPASIDFHVKVSKIQEKVLPELSDEWVDENTEFDTVEALREDYTTRVVTTRRQQANQAVQEGTMRALAELVSEDAPEPLVNQEVSGRIQNLSQSLRMQGMELEQYLQLTGVDPQQLINDLRGTAVDAVKADLALRAIVEAEEIEASDEEIDAELNRIGGASGVDVAELRAQLEADSRLHELRSDIKRSKALEWVRDHIEIVDEEGNPVDREALEEPAAADSEAEQSENKETE